MKKILDKILDKWIDKRLDKDLNYEEELNLIGKGWFYQFLYRKAIRDRKIYEIDADKKNRELELEIIRQELIEKDKQESLYRRVFAFTIFLSGVGLIWLSTFNDKYKDFLELGLFILGAGLYEHIPTGDKEGEKNNSFLTALLSFLFIILILMIQNLLPTSTEKTSKILWVILGIVTISFSKVFKRS